MSIDEASAKALPQKPGAPVVRLRSPLASLGLSGRSLDIGNWLAVAASIYLLITAVSVIGAGFKLATGGQAETLFSFAANPFVALMVGVLATAATQSSSTTTAVTVGLVAGGLPLVIAIPMLLGANIGTSLTNTLISLGMVRDSDSFRRAFSAATVHDFFNLTAVAIFLPLELAFGVLGRSSHWLAGQTTGTDGGVVAGLLGGIGEVVKAVTTPLADVIKHGTAFLGSPGQGIAMIVIGVALILLVINFVGKMLKVLMVGRAETVLHTALGRGPLTGIGSGIAVTVMVQSSTTTTCLLVPLAGSGKLTLRQIYPVTVGANIGTTITALIAAFGFVGAEAGLAMQAAYVHLLFNVFATLVIFANPLLHHLPLRGATWLGNVATTNKAWAAAWVLGVFVAVPLAAIGITTLL